MLSAGLAEVRQRVDQIAAHRSFVEATASLYGDLIVPAGHSRKSLMGPACLTLPNHDWAAGASAMPAVPGILLHRGK
jgi:hypothetical protein